MKRTPGHIESVCETIWAVARRLDGNVVAPSDFAHLASRWTVQRAFSELIECGLLMRLARGIYVAPHYNRTFDIVLPPAPEFVVDSLRARGEKIFPHGAATANFLGLTTQVPMRMIYWCEGPSRTLLFGKQNVELVHVEKRLLGGGKAGQLARAREWLGPRLPGRKRNYNF